MCHWIYKGVNMHANIQEIVTNGDKTSSQYLDFGGVYDRDKLYWKDILDVVLSCACAPPGGGRNPLTGRFVRHFAMFFISAPNAEAMKTIFKVTYIVILDCGYPNIVYCILIKCHTHSTYTCIMNCHEMF